MSTMAMRPTFSVETEMSAEEVMKQISDRVGAYPEILCGQFRRTHAMIAIVESKRHFWSPWLHLEINELAKGRQVFCRFSPHPSLWTGIMLTYLAIAVLMFFALVLGWSQQLMGATAWAYLLIPVGAVAIAVIWFGSQIGQRLAVEEMEELRRAVEEALAGFGPAPRGDREGVVEADAR